MVCSKNHADNGTNVCGIINGAKSNTNPISQTDALRAKICVNLACNRDSRVLPDDIPMHLFVEIPNLQKADVSFDFIRDDGTEGTRNDNNKEYSFNLLYNYGDRNEYIGYMANGDEGSVGDPSKRDNLSANGHRENHTHPSGTKVIRDRIHSWQQPLSKRDIENCVEGFIGKVWSMRSKTLYIYDKSGVKATIPFSVYGR